MNFQCELHFATLELIQDRIPTPCKIFVTILDLRSTDRREAIKQTPDLRSGESIDDIDAQVFGRIRSFDDLVSRTFLYIFRLAVAPDVRRQNGFMTLVNIITHSLPDEMGRNRPVLQPMLG